MMGRWFNHLTLYSLIWGGMLIFERFQLLRNYPITPLAWFYFFAAWVSLFIGSWLPLPRENSSAPFVPDAVELKRLRQVIYLFSILGIIGVISQAAYLSREYGGLLAAVFTNANAVYNTRLEGENNGLSYIGAFGFAGCPLAGIYTAKAGRLRLAGILPLAIVALSGIFTMGRGASMFAFVWFVSAFILMPRPQFKISKWALATILAVPLVGIGLISSVRGLGADFQNASPTLKSISEVFPNAPSFVSDISGPPAGFSQYLKRPDDHDSYFAMYTLAPVLRALARFGIGKGVPTYEEFYPTPNYINVCTWLKNIHSDFGPAGIFLFPLLVGLALTWITAKSQQHFMPIHGVILANGYLLILFSPFYNMMLLGGWYLSLGLGAVGAAWIQRGPLRNGMAATRRNGARTPSS